MNRIVQWFADTKVRNKILLGYALILAFMVLIGVVVFIQGLRIAAAGEEAARVEQVLFEIEQVSTAFAQATASVRDFAISADEQAIRDYESVRGQALEALARAQISLPPDADGHEEVARVRRLIDTHRDSVAIPVFELRRATLQPGGPDFGVIAAFYGQGTARGFVQRVREALDDLEAQQRTVARASRERVQESLQGMRWAIFLFTLLAAAIAFSVGAWIATRISRPLGEAVALADRVAAGDLTVDIPVLGRDEVGELSGTLNRMTADLRATLGGVTASTAQVASAAEEIAAAAEQISYTADQQVRSTEETSSSMEQIAAQITRVGRSTESLAVSVEQTSSSITQMSNSIEETATSADALGASVEQSSTTIEEMVASMGQVAKHVEETREIARDAEADAREGGDAVERTVDAMRRIHGETQNLVDTIQELGATSESIGQISEVIEDIADQTNLLALNAAIEAARAGEHGRGFAVVAQEIRRLAERSVESTREISQTIRGVQAEVSRAVSSTGEVSERTREGIHLADSAGQALEKIITSAGRTRNLMEEVALATQQQIRAAEQAQDAMRHIQRVSEEARIATREQASGTRQIVSAVENMSRQTREVFAATEEQKKGGEMILTATDQINQGARSTQTAIQEMANAAEDLSSQANRLTELVTAFRV